MAGVQGKRPTASVVRGGFKQPPSESPLQRKLQDLLVSKEIIDVRIRPSEEHDGEFLVITLDNGQNIELYWEGGIQEVN